MIAVDEQSSPQLLEAALQLAERAAADTDHAKAHILDTLAEVHFQLGHREAAVAAIDPTRTTTASSAAASSGSAIPKTARSCRRSPRSPWRATRMASASSAHEV
jgi:hypothetical protein